jgi:hypothetical protein
VVKVTTSGQTVLRDGLVVGSATNEKINGKCPMQPVNQCFWVTERQQVQHITNSPVNAPTRKEKLSGVFCSHSNGSGESFASLEF